MRFDGWPPQAMAWFEGLEQDNSRDYFTRTRAVYDECVRGPLLALVTELSGEFGEPKVFRPNRDVRFSADKSPYKTQASAVLHRDDGAGAHYVEVSSDGLLAASGYYQMTSDQLTRYRAMVDEDRAGTELVAIVEELERAGLAVHGESLKTAPRGYPRDHPRAKLLRHRSVTTMADLPPGRPLTTRKALTHVTTTWRAAIPLNTWLATHVGPSTTPPDSRPR